MRSRLVAILMMILISMAAFPARAEDPILVGRWSEPFWEGGALAYDPPSAEKSRLFPTAASAVALPDGRLLYWNALEGSENGDLWVGRSDGTAAIENSRTRILDLRSDDPRWTIPTRERGVTDDARDQGPYATKDYFCGDQKLLYDGTLLIAGGSEWRFDMQRDPTGSDVYGDDEARVFDPTTDSFRSVAPMREARWYPSLVTLADGRGMVASGVKRLGGSFAEVGTSFSQVRLNEVYDPATETWTDAGTSEWSLPLYPRLHLLPDGTVFFGGNGQTWGQLGETPDMATWASNRTYDPATQKWTIVGPSRYGVRGSASSVLLRLEPPYDHADILVAGGTLGASPGSWAATTVSEVVRWTPEGIASNGKTKDPFAGLNGDHTQLRSPRWLGSGVVLPTGEVLLMNGGDLDDTVDPGAAAAVRTPELYDPATGTWRPLVPGSRDRVYHNSAVLLADGRVLVGGHAPHTAHYTRHDNTATRSNNFRDSTFEIYEPPYLFRGARPVINSMAISADRRSLIVDATNGDEVVLVRLGSVTHGQDADTRAVVLERTLNADGTVTAALPRSGAGAIAPPGPYYVFVNRLGPDGSVPSVAQTILVQPDSGTGGVVFARP